MWQVPEPTSPGGERFIKGKLHAGVRLLGFLGVTDFGVHHFQLLDACSLLLWINSFANESGRLLRAVREWSVHSAALAAHKSDSCHTSCLYRPSIAKQKH